MKRHVTVLCETEEDAEVARAALELVGYAVHTAVAPAADEVSGRVGRQSDTDELQRLAALGTAAAGTAHEVNNLLTPLLVAVGNAEQAIAAAPALDQDDRLAQQLRDARTACLRIQTLAAELLGFARTTGDTARPVDLHDLLEEAVRVVDSELRRTARVVRDYARNLSAVKVVPGRLVQVFVNLLLNAIHALEDAVGDSRIVISTTADGVRVRIDIEDNGPGIPPEVLPHIFEPFYTTREAGGTGLGLSVSRDILAGFGGDVVVHSEVGRGSRFSVYLPALA